MQSRDVALFCDLMTHGLMARRHIEQVHFSSTVRCNARLLQLVEAGYLLRFYPPGLQNASQAIYRLAAPAFPVVAHALDMELDEVRRICRTRRNQHLEHSLGVLDVLSELRRKIVGRPGLRLDLLLSEWQARQEYRVVHGGKTMKRVFRPDALFRLELPDGRLSCYALEYDRANASLKTKWVQCVANHCLYLRSGLFARRFSDNPDEELTTLVVTTGGPRRLARMRAVAAEQGATFFRFATEHDMREAGLFAPIWWLPTGEEQVTLP